MSAPLHDCVFRVWRDSGSGRAVVGTGFLAAGADGECYALTCAHVVNLALDRALMEESRPQGASVTVDLKGRKAPLTLDLVDWRAPAPLIEARATDIADIAVFTIRPPFTPPYRPPLRIEPPGRVVPPDGRVAFHSFGFMGTQNGVSTKGTLSAVDAGGWFVVDGDGQSGRFVEEGLSGAPVFADGRVLGMVVQRLELGSRQGLVIPAFALARAWPPLASPYPGLPAFDAGTAHLFFGRGRPMGPEDAPAGTLRLLLDRLRSSGLLTLMGASGSGKSSLAKAGVADAHRRDGWLVLTLRPRLSPLRHLAEAIAREVEGLGPGTELREAVKHWEQALAAGRLGEALGLARERGAAGVLILIDQFEEFFPGPERGGEAGDGGTAIARDRALILPQIRRAVERGEARCLLTARLDLIEGMVAGDAEGAWMLKDPYPLVMLTRMVAAEVREAIEGPAALFGVRADPGFATDLAAAVTREEGRLPLLQETLRRCWAALRRDPDGGWWLRAPLDAAEPDAATLLEESLARRGDEALVALRADPADAQRVLLGMVRWVDGRRVRRILPLADVTGEDRALLERLAAERLVVIDDDRKTAELVHESLMVRWPLLAGWIEGQREFLDWRDRFDRDFAVWRDGGRDAKHALRRHDLDMARAWADGTDRTRVRPTADQAAFVAASRTVHEAEDRRREEELRRTRRWLRVAAVALGLMLLALVGGGFALNYALDETARAEREAERAAERTDAAQLQESRALAILAQRESAQGDHGTAMLLALEALPEPVFGGKRPVSAEASAALRQAWMRNLETTLVGHTDKVVAASFSPDGRRVVTASSDGTARVWDLSGPTHTTIVLEGHTDGVLAASFSPDGRRVVTASWDRTARVWDLSGPAPTATVLAGHTGPLWDASFSPDGRRVVTASPDGTARVWDLSGTTPTAIILAGHSDAVRAATFSPDGRRVVTASLDGTARVWDLSGPTPTATVLEGHTDTVWAASFSPDGRRVVTASDDTTARVWDLSGPRPTAMVLEGHTGGVRAASFSPDGRRVVTASRDKSARVWDLTGPTPTATVLEGHTGGVRAASFSPDGRRVVTASWDQTARVWDLTGPTPTATVLEGHTDGVQAASFSPDGRRVVTASEDNTARVWDLSGPTPTATVLEGHTRRVRAASFSPDGRRVVTASWDRTARVWDLSGPTPTASVVEGHTERVTAASFSADGRRVVTASWDQTAQVWDLSGPTPTATVLEGHTDWVTAATFSPDGGRVVTTSADKTARVWDLSGPMPTATVLAGHTGAVVAASFSPDGRRVVTASWDRTARVWDRSGPTPTATVLARHTGEVYAASFSPDGRRVVTASEDFTVRVWDLSGPTPTATVLAGHTRTLIAATFSPDSRRFLTVSSDWTARAWDLSEPTPTATVLEGHTGRVRVATFGPDGRRVVTASADGTARVWDLAGPTPTAIILEGHTGWVYAASFSLDGRRVVTASSDETARVWDLSGPTPTAMLLEGHTGPVNAASFSPDGRLVVTASFDGTARVWPVYPDIAELASLVRSRLTRCLSSAQREAFGLVVVDTARRRDVIPAPDADGRCPR